MTIETGISFDDLEKESKPQEIPDGTYEFNVQSITETTTKDGRPRWIWALRIINRPDIPNRTILYGTVMPWIGMDDKLDVSGSGFLVDIMNGTNTRFDGVIPLPGSTKDNNQYPPKELWFGKTGVLKYSKKQRKKQDPNDPNEEAIFDDNAKIVTKRSSGGLVS